MKRTKRYIDLTVTPKGAASVSAHGFAGSSCRQATASLEQSLGLVQDRQETAEQYVEPTTVAETVSTGVEL